MKPKSLLQQNGVEVARRVVEGKADLGLTLSGEVASVEGAVIAGPLPPPYGQDTTYTAAVSAGSAAPDAGRGLHRGADRPGRPRDLAEGRVRSAAGVTPHRAAKLAAKRCDREERMGMQRAAVRTVWPRPG